MVQLINTNIKKQNLEVQPNKYSYLGVRLANSRQFNHRFFFIHMTEYVEQFGLRATAPSNRAEHQTLLYNNQ